MRAKSVVVASVAILAIALCPGVRAAPLLEGEEPITFTAQSGETVEAFRGGFLVPERRSDPGSRMIPIRYVRFPATGEQPGSPIVYLAGGPGGPGILTAKGGRFPLFMAMREFGDVIALDQRGVGEAKVTPTCTSSVTLEADQPYADAEIARLYRQAAEECGAFWKGQGIDIAGYVTTESVQDLDALRAHLGAEKITLWGISYGTHLALAALKDMDDRIDRVVLASAEGLDQTVKLPVFTDAYFDRLQAAVDSQPAARGAYPDIAGMIERVHARLAEEPLTVHVDAPDGGSTPVLLTTQTMQLIASRMISDPQVAAQLLALYAALDAGVDEVTTSAPLTAILEAVYSESDPITLEAMPLAMDVASGISDARLATFETQAQTALLGPYLNFPMPQLRGLYGLDLGEGFRAASRSDVPTLLLSGTLDGRTYLEEQTLAVAGLSDLTHVVVVNAGHNLFMTTPEVTRVMQEFMRGEPIETREIVAPLPDLAGQAPD